MQPKSGLGYMIHTMHQQHPIRAVEAGKVEIFAGKCRSSIAFYQQIVQTSKQPPKSTKEMVDSSTVAPSHLIPAKVILENGLDELLLVDLAHRIPGNVINHPQDLGNFVVDQAPL